MGIRKSILSYMAGQAGGPSGPVGRMLAIGLNRGNRDMIRAAAAACELVPGDTAADVGFGGGAGLELLLKAVGPGGRVDGIEVSATMLKRATSHFRAEVDAGWLRLSPGSATRLPPADGMLDALISVNTVYFMPDLAPMMTEARRVLRPGGRLVIGIRDPAAMGQIPITRYGFELRRSDEVAAAMTAAGFEVGEQCFGAGHRAAVILVGR